MGTVACWTRPLIFICSFLFGPTSAHQRNLLSQVPFFIVWNAPTQNCASHYGVDLDLSIFDLIHNQNETFIGNNVTIFYSDRFGYYPHYVQYKEPVYGGVPQNSSLKDHLLKAEADLLKYIPGEDFQGLAVVDWESWRPLWERNWDRKDVYKNASRALVTAEHPDWNPEQIEAQAMKDFHDAAQAFMEKTLKLGSDRRPRGLWGFYGFPDCYNYDYKTRTYTGKCPPMEVLRNDKLAWLWSASTALYPSIYLDKSLKGHNKNVLLYARHRILEGLRVREQALPIQPVIIPYSRIVYTYSLEFLSQEDLVHTIGESVALGAAGIVLWGDASFSANKSTCQEVQDYIQSTLGQYVVNVTEAAALCSASLCSSHGRCVRRISNSSAYLHLDPALWTIIPRSELPRAKTNSPSFVIQLRMKSKKYTRRNQFAKHFKCQCFSDWKGDQCEKRVTHRPI